MSRVKEFCSWIEDVVNMSIEDRAKLVRSVIDALKSYREGKVKPADKRWLTDFLSEDAELIGFAGNLNYVVSRKRTSGMNPAQFRHILLHPWGSPALLYKHKTLPVFMIVGPGLELDKEVIGATG